VFVQLVIVLTMSAKPVAARIARLGRLMSMTVAFSRYRHDARKARQGRFYFRDRRPFSARA
jgi:hypothetical protein